MEVILLLHKALTIFLNKVIQWLRLEFFSMLSSHICHGPHPQIGYGLYRGRNLAVPSQPHLAAGERRAVLGIHILQLVHVSGRRESCFITCMPLSVLVPPLCERCHSVKLLQCVPASCSVPARESPWLLTGCCHDYWCLRAVLIQPTSSQLYPASAEKRSLVRYWSGVL